MDEQKLKMFSFIETIISNEKHCMERGNHILMQHIFMNEFYDILKQNEQKIIITRERYPPEKYELAIQIPESDSEQLNLIKSDELFESDKEINQQGGKSVRYSNLPLADKVTDKEFVVDVESDSLIEYLNNEMNGGKPCPEGQVKQERSSHVLPKSILKRKVQFNINNDSNLLDIDSKTNENKKDKLSRKLNTMWAEQVKNLGKELGIKPRKGGNLSKIYVTKRILANPKLHDKALKTIRKIDIVKSDTASEN